MAKDFLSIIVEHKKKEIEIARKTISEQDLKKQADSHGKRRPFFESLKKNKGTGVNIIAEIKRASPSKGDIALDLDPSNLAASYEKGGAACLSVLTDARFFKGSFADFTAARMACSLPMLRKDFLISDYQILESAALGADAVLLIARILTREKMKDLLLMSQDLGMDALVEIHNEKDLESANYAGATLIGINNRNLSSFETDISTATTLCAALGTDQIPVAASGISSRADIDKNLRAGIHHFLIGESLVRAKDTTRFLSTLISGETYHEPPTN
ncbi:MAG: indole-3-glycerol phosphate synthase TrpC [Proteobacteria bacterium]|nr:indole-3-glycerol phosphate synthase TrpC [Pseudomonadota bacterium]